MKLIDADLIPIEISFDPKENKAFRDVIDEQPNVPAIPIDFIESEKRFVNDLSFEAYEAGNIDRAKELSKVALNLDALISNWRFFRGDEWRENRKEVEDGQQ